MNLLELGIQRKLTHAFIHAAGQPHADPARAGEAARWWLGLRGRRAARPADDATGRAAELDREREVFDVLDRCDVPCCPDYWPYDELRVMAMRRYRPFDGDSARSHVGLVLHGDVSAPNCGVDEDGRVVLLDGGSALFVPGAMARRTDST